MLLVVKVDISATACFQAAAVPGTDLLRVWSRVRLLFSAYFESCAHGLMGVDLERDTTFACSTGAIDFKALRTIAGGGVLRSMSLTV